MTIGEIFQSSMMAHLIVKNCSFRDIRGALMINSPSVEGDVVALWGYVDMYDHTVYNCSGVDRALLVAKTYGWLTVYDVTFINNFGLNTGSIALAGI